jgi:hypothetical protein
MKDSITFFIVGILYLATLYTLVRPNSNGPTLVKNVLGTFSDLVRGVSGQTYNSQTNAWSTGNG